MEFQPPLPLRPRQLQELAADKAEELRMLEPLRTEHWANPHLRSHHRHRPLPTRNRYCYV